MHKCKNSNSKCNNATYEQHEAAHFDEFRRIRHHIEQFARTLATGMGLLDEAIGKLGTGKVLDTATVYPFQPRNDREGTLRTLAALCARHGVQLIAIGLLAPLVGLQLGGLGALGLGEVRLHGA